MSQVSEEKNEETLETANDTETIEKQEIEQTEEMIEELEEVSIEEQLRAQLGEAEDKFLRAQAEIANMRNRFQKEREALARYRSQDLAKELLPALDNLDRALETEVTDENGQNLKKGVEMVRDSIIVGFNSAGVEEIPAMGEIFDPNFHQAVQTVPIQDGQKPDEIVQVLQKGYKLNDRVLRPTMVIVAQ